MGTKTRDLHILRTNICTDIMLREVAMALNTHEAIHQWSIDLEDVDKVLRIETKKKLLEKDLLQLIETHGYSAEDLN